MPTIKIDKEKCIGCGLCASLCEKSFELIGDKAKVKTSKISKITCEQEAADSCPVDAIKLS